MRDLRDWKEMEVLGGSGGTCGRGCACRGLGVSELSFREHSSLAEESQHVSIGDFDMTLRRLVSKSTAAADARILAPRHKRLGREHPSTPLCLRIVSRTLGLCMTKSSP